MSRYWVIIPAAGVGARMQADCPKQYLSLCGKTVLEQTLSLFTHIDAVQQVVVVVSRDDAYWQKTIKHSKITTVIGGEARCDSVFNALTYLKTVADDDDWILTHDAARPCVKPETIQQLMKQLANHPIGGLLAQPVRDTMKRSDTHGKIINTVERDHLWHAQTPQMFRCGLLHQALVTAFKQNIQVTDEAQAMELSGYYGQLVPSDVTNIKITHPEDLALATFYLR